MDFKFKFDTFRKQAEEYFIAVFNNENENDLIQEAAKYSFFGGGKRIRPIIMLATAEFLGLNIKTILPFCFAVECIHIHSLIHDDLPALDNDSLRRGKPCCHIVYGEDIALLAGDYLLNKAYQSILAVNLQNSNNAFLQLANAAELMLRGQAFDTKADESLNNEDILKIYSLKTSALIKACFLVPTALSGKKDLLEEFDKLGDTLGLLFQITDDLIDYKANFTSFNDNAKVDLISLSGIQAATALKEKLKFECLKILDKIGEFDFIKQFIWFVAERES